VDDLQRQPQDEDRDQVAARINRAHNEGRIGVADRDIRLGNVRSAQSMAELDLMSRELDQLEAALPSAPTDTPGPTAAEAPWSRFEPGAPDDSTSGPARPVVVTLLVVIAVALVVAGVVYAGVRVSGSLGESSADPGLPGSASSGPASPGGETADPGSTAPRSTYALTAAGIRGFLETYRKRFGTSRVVDLTLFGDYAIVNVPVPGKARQAGWLFRGAAGWTSFGDVRAVFPGARIVDTRRLAIAPLVRNIRRARRTLNVEGPAQTYVIVRFVRPSDDVPRVDIHVANRFNESGYLATTLDGHVRQAYPYGS
jgi:Domain of unknown function (DUF1707)